MKTTIDKNLPIRVDGLRCVRLRAATPAICHAQRVGERTCSPPPMWRAGISVISALTRRKDATKTTLRRKLKRRFALRKKRGATFDTNPYTITTYNYFHSF
jgi:hypothetical protein